jgi:phage shock protein PspC (stress-responsive transcriptional regulator)
MEQIDPAPKPAESHPPTSEPASPTSEPASPTSEPASPTDEPTPSTDEPTPSTDQPPTDQLPRPAESPAEPPAESPAEPAPTTVATERERPTPDRLSARLRRRRDGRMVAGVCTGLGVAWGIDPVLARLIFAVIGVIFFPLGPLAYVVFWMLMPEED